MPKMIKDQIVKECEQLLDLVKKYDKEYKGTDPVEDAMKIHEETMRLKLAVKQAKMDRKNHNSN